MAIRERPNVVVIVIDTLRYDKAATLTGVLEGIKDYGWAVTPAPWTLPAHVSLLTGLYPSVHGSHETVDVKWQDIAAIRNRSPTLMMRLKALGYTSYGFSANAFISREFGFDGFDDLVNWNSNPILALTQLLRSMDERSLALFMQFWDSSRGSDLVSLMVYLLHQDPRLLSKFILEILRIVVMALKGDFVRGKGTKQATKFLKRTSFREPFFLFMNLLDVHEPYLRDDLVFAKGDSVKSTEAIPKPDLDAWVSGYDSQAKGLSKVVSTQLGILKERGLLDNSLVIITSDHGQLLGEHNWVGHGVFLFDELVKVPLLVKYPSDVELTPRRGHISLTSIPRLVLDIVQGRADDSSLYSARVFSESWGSYERTGAKTEGAPGASLLKERRTCVFTDSGKVTYNFSRGEVEEAVLEAGADGGEVEKMAGACIGFEDLNERIRRALA